MRQHNSLHYAWHRAVKIHCRTQYCYQYVIIILIVVVVVVIYLVLVKMLRPGFCIVTVKLHTVGVATSPGPRGDRTETNSVADAARTGDAHRAHVFIYKASARCESSVRPSVSGF